MEGATSGAVGAPDVSKAVVKNVDMEADMQHSVLEIATESMNKFQLEKDMAAFIKRTVDDQYGPTWHVIVGKSFGSYVTHGMWMETDQRIQVFHIFLPRKYGILDLARLISDISFNPRRQFKPAATNTDMNVLWIDEIRLLGPLLI